MAFNPFRAFRKHQKVLFAVLTILCMFVFVLSGVGGVFQELAGRLAGGDRFPEMASAYSKPISERELRLLQQQRAYANLFMFLAVQQATLNSGQAVEHAVAEGKLDPNTKQALTEAIGLRRIYTRNDPQRGYAEYSNFNLELLKSPQFLVYLQNILGQLEQAQLSLEAQKSQDAGLVREMQDVLRRDFELLQRARSGQYFEEYKGPKDLIDFLLLRHHADQLGIQFTGEDVDHLVTRETREALRPGESALILKNVQRRFGGLTRDMLRSALGDEFRVRIARDALFGKPEQRQEAGLTPYEFWKFYRENRTTSNFVLASIPVDTPEFLKKVGQPTEQELRSLFEANKDREPDPASEQAGFKQPMRIRVQWVSAPTDSPLYERAAALESAVSLPLAYDLALLRAYESERYKYPVPSWLAWRMALQQKNITRVENIVAALGEPAASVWPSVAAAAAYNSAAAACELRDRSTARRGFDSLTGRPQSTELACSRFRGHAEGGMAPPGSHPGSSRQESRRRSCRGSGAHQSQRAPRLSDGSCSGQVGRRTRFPEYMRRARPSPGHWHGDGTWLRRPRRVRRLFFREGDGGSQTIWLRAVASGVGRFAMAGSGAFLPA